jgi:hypothetical protein
MNELPMPELVRAILILIAALGIIILIATGIGRERKPAIKVWKPQEPGQNWRNDEK